MLALGLSTPLRRAGAVHCRHSVACCLGTALGWLMMVTKRSKLIEGGDRGEHGLIEWRGAGSLNRMDKQRIIGQEHFQGQNHEKQSDMCPIKQNRGASQTHHPEKVGLLLRNLHPDTTHCKAKSRIKRLLVRKAHAGSRLPTRVGERTVCLGITIKHKQREVSTL